MDTETAPEAHRIVIDQRPLPVLLIVRYRRALSLILLGILFAWALTHEPPSGLSVEGWRCLCVFGLAVALWISNIIPMVITGLLVICLLPGVKILPADEAYSLFGNEAIFFILGAFIIAGASIESGLSRRIALFLLTTIGTTPRRLLAAIMGGSAFMSFWMPEHAVAALLYPVVREAAVSLGIQKGKSNYGKMLFISLAWGCSIGGVGTFLGGARNPLAVGMLYDYHQVSIGFFEWMVAIVPVVILTLPVAFILLLRAFPTEVVNISAAREILAADRKRLSRVTSREALVGGVIVTTVLCWMVFSDDVGVASIALASAVVLFALNLINWEEAAKNIGWGILIFYGAAISLGVALDQTGAAEWLATGMLGAFSDPSPFKVAALIVVLSMLLTQCMSNAAAVAFLMPIGFGLAQANSLDPKILTYCVAVPAGLSFMLPIGTPPNAICFASGYYRISDSVRSGFLLTLFSVGVFLFIARFYWPLVGLDF